MFNRKLTKSEKNDLEDYIGKDRNTSPMNNVTNSFVSFLGTRVLRYVQNQSNIADTICITCDSDSEFLNITAFYFGKIIRHTYFFREILNV